MTKKTTETLDITTEEKIKEAARAVFFRKGYAGTRTRDIAEESGINLALLNYYFRSKEKLFGIIMSETMSVFIRSILGVLNNESTTLEKKIEDIASKYIDLILKEPEIPLFLLSEIRNDPHVLLNKFGLKADILESVLFKQYAAAVKQGKIKEPDPLQFIMNLLGLIIFPFVAKPMLIRISGIEEDQFNERMRKRKALIPAWIKAMIQAE